MNEVIRGEKIIIPSGTIKALSPSEYLSGKDLANFVEISVLSGNIIFTLDGTGPTANEGHPAPSGTNFSLEGAYIIEGFKAYASSDAELYVTYEIIKRGF